MSVRAAGDSFFLGQNLRGTKGDKSPATPVNQPAAGLSYAKSVLGCRFPGCESGSEHCTASASTA